MFYVLITYHNNILVLVSIISTDCFHNCKYFIQWELNHNATKKLFSVATFNVRGLINHTKQEELYDIDKYKIYILTRNKNIRTLQENYYSWKQINNNTIKQSTLQQWFHFKQKN